MGTNQDSVTKFWLDCQGTKKQVVAVCFDGASVNTGVINRLQARISDCSLCEPQFWTCQEKEALRLMAHTIFSPRIVHQIGKTVLKCSGHVWFWGAGNYLSLWSANLTNYYEREYLVNSETSSYFVPVTSYFGNELAGPEISSQVTPNLLRSPNLLSKRSLYFSNQLQCCLHVSYRQTKWTFCTCFLRSKIY